MEILGGTGQDGIFLGKILGGTGRLFFFRGGTGRLLFFSEAGRGGRFFFPKRDGAVVVFFRGGTGRLFFFSEAGRGGCIFFSRRDGTGWLCFFSAGTGRLYFLFAPGRAMRMAHVNCKFLHLAFKIVSSANIFIFHLNDEKIRNCKFQTNNERFNTYFNLQEQKSSYTICIISIKTVYAIYCIYLIATFIKLVSTVHLDQENSFLDLLKPCIMVIVV